MDGRAADLSAWATSGAMMLSGPADGAPSAAAAPLASAMIAAASDLRRETARWGRAVDVDGPALLGERAAITGMSRAGATSVGGSARFVPVADGWVALNLPRPEDVAALPALVGAAVDSGDWPSVAARLATMSSASVVAQATLLGLAVGVPGRHRPVDPASPIRELARGGGRRVTGRPLVVDMGALWAAPLAGQLLAAAGARVVKVEGRRRPDGARLGSTAFYDLLNHDKECASVDLDDAADRGFLHRLLGRADLVIEASRPRVMDAIGVDPVRLAAAGTNWVSITAHGRVGEASLRVGFGDDAAVEGGLVVSGATPMFVADAVADPLTGLVVAAFAAELLGGERAAVIEAPLAHVAAWAARPPCPADVIADGEAWTVVADGDRVRVASPRHRPIPGPARPTGADDAALRAEFAP